MTHHLDTIVALGAEHKVAIREKVTLLNMLKARVRQHVGVQTLLTGEGFKLDRKKCEEAYKHYLTDVADPMFITRVEHLWQAYILANRIQFDLARQMEKQVIHLRIWSWAKAQRGCGAAVLAKIIAECGRDLGEYDSPAKLQKRFGLHVENGAAPRRKRGEKLDFDPYRRSVVWQLGDCMIKAGGTAEKGNLSFWKRMYEQRKAEYLGRQGMTLGHAHNMAKRYMEKQFLRQLWEEWTDNREGEVPLWIKDAA